MLGQPVRSPSLSCIRVHLCASVVSFCRFSIGVHRRSSAVSNSLRVLCVLCGKIAKEQLMAKELGFGIIGCGEIAVATAKGIAEAENARIARVMDVREELARDLGEKYGARWTASQEELLADPAVEAVYIAVPHFLHAPIAVQAA